MEAYRKMLANRCRPFYMGMARMLNYLASSHLGFKNLLLFEHFIYLFILEREIMAEIVRESTNRRRREEREKQALC